MKLTARTNYLLAIAVALAAALFLIFSVGALGIIGDGSEDRIYAAVLAVGAVGTVIARLRPGGMALALVATAVTMVLVTVVALIAGVPQDENASVVDVLGITVMFAGLFSLSAWLFSRAADQRSEVAV
jgi:hypothetical protein